MRLLLEILRHLNNTIFKQQFYYSYIFNFLTFNNRKLFGGDCVIIPHSNEYSFKYISSPAYTFFCQAETFYWRRVLVLSIPRCETRRLSGARILTKTTPFVLCQPGTTMRISSIFDFRASLGSVVSLFGRHNIASVVTNVAPGQWMTHHESCHVPGF